MCGANAIGEGINIDNDYKNDQSVLNDAIAAGGTIIGAKVPNIRGIDKCERKNYVLINIQAKTNYIQAIYDYNIDKAKINNDVGSDIFHFN